MKKSRITFLLAEIFLAVLTIYFVRHIFAGREPYKRVAVIVESSGDEKWDSFVNGLKQAAAVRNIHLIICNTDEIEDADEAEHLINEQLENNVDAFIIQAAPGYGMSELLEEVTMKKPVILVANDVLVPELESNIHEVSKFSRIMPDNYDMGYQLGQAILRDSASTDKKTVGIVGGLAQTECAKKRAQGVKDALKDSGYDISWEVCSTYDSSAYEIVKKQKKVDVIIALETELLEELAEYKSDDSISLPGLYGVGNSVKCVYYLDKGLIQGLVMADGFEMGYDSISELAQSFEKSFYSIKSHTTAIRVVKKADIYTEEFQQFLYAY